MRWKLPRDGEGSVVMTTHEGTSSPGKEASRIPRFFIVTGISGSGKSTALNMFEDHGLFVIDNIPPALLLQLVDILQHHQGALEKGVAAGIDVRGDVSFEKIPLVVREIRSLIPKTTTLFFDAEDQKILERYETTRRQHPFRGFSLLEAIRQERQLLAPLKALADRVVDTSALSIQKLQSVITNEILADPEHSYSLELSSFGFKYGFPENCNYLFDVRFLPNPFYYDTLRYFTGKDLPVQDFVFQYPEAKIFLDAACSLVNSVLPYYLTKGKSLIHIAVGCTGGRHRSVAVIEKMKFYFDSCKIPVRVFHRDIDKEEYQ